MPFNFDNAVVTYHPTSRVAVYPSCSRDPNNVPVLTFPDDPTLSYEGDISVKEKVQQQGQHRLFAFKLILRVRNASASTSLSDGPGVGGKNPGLGFAPFPDTKIMKIAVQGQREPGLPILTKFDIVEGTALKKDFCFFMQRFTGGDDSSAIHGFFNSTGTKVSANTVSGFSDRDFPVRTSTGAGDSG